MPRSVAGIIYGLQHYADVPSECLEWHGHNDFYKAVANASTAWLYGACAVNCSLLGIGERTGNIPLEAMVFEYASLRGSMDGMDPTVITEIADYFRKSMERYRMHPQTQKELDFLLEMLAEKGEKATFAYIKNTVIPGKPFPWEEDTEE